MARRPDLRFVHDVLDHPQDLLVLCSCFLLPLHWDILVLLVRSKLAPRLQASLLRSLDQVELGLGDPETNPVFFVFKVVQLGQLLRLRLSEALLLLLQPLQLALLALLLGDPVESEAVALAQLAGR